MNMTTLLRILAELEQAHAGLMRIVSAVEHKKPDCDYAMSLARKAREHLRHMEWSMDDLESVLTRQGASRGKVPA